MAAIEQLLEKESLARIIVTGDFNHLLPLMMDGLKKLNIHPAIPTDIATHRGGSQLDQIFTNQQVLEWGTGSVDDQVTDHLPLRVSIKLIKRDGEQTIYDKKVGITQGVIRKAARS